MIIFDVGLYGETSVDAGLGVIGLAFIVRFYFSLEVLFLMDGGGGRSTNETWKP